MKFSKGDENMGRQKFKADENLGWPFSANKVTYRGPKKSREEKVVLFLKNAII